MEAESVYTATGYASEGICDILEVQRRGLCFPAGGTIPLTRAQPARYHSRSVRCKGMRFSSKGSGVDRV